MVERKLSCWQSYFVNDLSDLGSFAGWELSCHSNVDRRTSGLEDDKCSDRHAVIDSINLARCSRKIAADRVSYLGL